MGWRSYRAGEFERRRRGVRAARRARSPRADNRPAWLYWAGRSRDRLDEHDHGQRALPARRRRLSELATTAGWRRRSWRRAASRRSRRRASRPSPAATVAPVVDDRRHHPLADHGADVSATRCARCSTPSACGAIRRSCRPRRRGSGTSRVWRSRPRSALRRCAAPSPRCGAPIRSSWPPAAKRCRPTCCASSSRSTTGRSSPSTPTLHQLDPYLIAALMAQESTFTAEIRSHANAYGLMQIIPGTGRRYARKLGITPFTTAMLRQPEIERPDRHAVLPGPDRPLRRRALRAGELQRRRVARRPLDRGAARHPAGRVHRRHPVSRRPRTT